MSLNWYCLPRFIAGSKIIAIRWVFKIKADSTYKSRLVLEGLSHIRDVDCGGTFDPVCRFRSIRIMLAIVGELYYEVHMLDVQTAFLNTDDEEGVFIQMAPGYGTNNKAGVRLSMKPKKNLYGLCQSQKNWLDTMDVELAVISFHRLKSDPCVYIYEDETGFVILTLYVDDIMFLSASKSPLKKLKKR